MWRPMTLVDIPVVIEIADAVWGCDYYEDSTVFLNKLNLYPQGCKMYQDLGYIFSHPWAVNNPPKLNSLLDLHTKLDCYHIHDIALLPGTRNKNIATDIIARILQENKTVSLVAANGTETFWRKFNFVATKVPCNYGIYMIKYK